MVGGLAYGLGAYGFWGLIPLYFQAVAHLSPMEVLAHRVVWSVCVLLGLIAVRGRLGEFRQLFASGKILLWLVLSTSLIAANWYANIYAMTTGRVLHASLGYFLTPLMQIVLGCTFLGERPRPLQWLGIGLASAGVLYFSGGGIPWISLVLAGSFSFYGLVRKVVQTDGLFGLTVECSALCPIALAYIGWLLYRGESGFLLTNRLNDVLLLLSSVVTVTPLLLFVAAARRLRLSTIGMLQFLAPSVQFVLAVFAFGEPFDQRRLVSFCLIWTALVIYVGDSWLKRRGEESKL